MPWLPVRPVGQQVLARPDWGRLHPYPQGRTVWSQRVQAALQLQIEMQQQLRLSMEAHQRLQAQLEQHSRQMEALLRIELARTSASNARSASSGQSNPWAALPGGQQQQQPSERAGSLPSRGGWLPPCNCGPHPLPLPACSDPSLICTLHLGSVRRCPAPANRWPRSHGVPIPTAQQQRQAPVSVTPEGGMTGWPPRAFGVSG